MVFFALRLESKGEWNFLFAARSLDLWVLSLKAGGKFGFFLRVGGVIATLERSGG